MAAAVTVAAALLAFPLAYLHGALRLAAAQGAAVPGGAAAAVVQLPGARVCLEDHPGQRGHPGLVHPCAGAGLRAKRAAAAAGGGRAVALELVHRPVHGVPIRVAAVHDPAHPVRAGAAAALAAGGLGRPGRAAAGHACGTWCCRWSCPAWWPGRSSPSRSRWATTSSPKQFGNSSFFIGRAVQRLPGHLGQRAAGGGLHRGADCHHGHLSDAGAQGRGRSMRSKTAPQAAGAPARRGRWRWRRWPGCSFSTCRSS